MGRNVSRSDVASRANEKLENAHLIGIDQRGYICVWNGGYSFSVYDMLDDWQEVNHFTSGQMVEFSDVDKAKQRMESEGYEVFEPAE